MKMKDLENKIICGDCLEKLKYISDESIDLIYLDPPFFSKKDYEVVWGNGAELKAFGDRWKGGIKHYIDWMTDRVREMWRVLKSTGSIYLHCDKHANHHLRIMLDKIFGEKNFRNEIIWGYRTGGISKRFFPQKHDNIYWYSKSNKWTYHPIKERIYYEKPFFNDQQDEEGRYYADVFIRDVWDDTLKPVINVSKERIGYPTQKPESLLERIILASSNEEDIILDPFVGGGTTCAVAKRLKRKYIGIDVSPIGCATTLKRLEGEKDIRDKLFEIIDYPATESDLMELSGLELQQWMMIQLHAKINPKLSADGGIDGWFVDGTPIEVKKGALTRPAVQKLHSAAITDGKNKAVLIGKTVAKPVFEKVAELKLEHDFEVIIMTLQQVIDRDFKVLLESGIPVRDKTLQDYY